MRVPSIECGILSTLRPAGAWAGPRKDTAWFRLPSVSSTRDGPTCEACFRRSGPPRAIARGLSRLPEGVAPPRRAAMKRSARAQVIYTVATWTWRKGIYQIELYNEPELEGCWDAPRFLEQTMIRCAGAAARGPGPQGLLRDSALKVCARPLGAETAAERSLPLSSCGS